MGPLDGACFGRNDALKGSALLGAIVFVAAAAGLLHGRENGLEAGLILDRRLGRDRGFTELRELHVEIGLVGPDRGQGRRVVTRLAVVREQGRTLCGVVSEGL